MFRTSPFLRWEKLRCSQQAKAHKKKPHKWLVYAIYGALFIYSVNPLYPQKAKSFILTYFLFQGILGLPSRSWLTLSFFSLISRYSSIFKAFSMVSSKRKGPHINGFSALQGLYFLVILFIP